jgi:hypothetical protein
LGLGDTVSHDPGDEDREPLFDACCAFCGADLRRGQHNTPLWDISRPPWFAAEAKPLTPSDKVGAEVLRTCRADECRWAARKMQEASRTCVSMRVVRRKIRLMERARGLTP